MSELYKKSIYLNRDIDYLFNSEIIEYDIEEAGFNIIKYFKLLPDEEINKLSKLSKKNRHIQIGLLQKRDKSFGKNLNESFSEARKLFLSNNNLNEENILSIKKDAIFVFEKRCKFKVFDNINFRMKNNYFSYINLANNEYYINNKNVDVKGISEDCIIKHLEYMIDTIQIFSKLLSYSDRKSAIKFLINFIRYYKNRELELGYYRELNRRSMYRVIDLTLHDKYYFSDTGTEVEKLNIMYNYIEILRPLISIVL